MITNPRDKEPETIVVIGNGMVGHRFCERLIEYDAQRHFKIVTFCEEPRAAYDRVGLTQFFAHRDAEKLMLANLQWYEKHGIELHIGDRANKIDRGKKVVLSDRGLSIAYDHVVLATGSHPFVPDVPGIRNQGVFVYRTIEDLERIIAFGKKSESAAIIGGGLLGLEAAKAIYDLNLNTHIVEFAPRLMARQTDETGSAILVNKIEELGVKVHLNKVTQKVLGDGRVDGMLFSDGEQLQVDMIVVSAGIRPRDELAKDCGLKIGERGGVLINDYLETSDPNIYAIGEVALHDSMIYGLVAPGYAMADTLAANLTGNDKRFNGADMSTKLKLMGVDVASFGRHDAPDDVSRSVTFEDPFSGIYKKLLISPDGSKLLGGILVGDASQYGQLLMLTRSEEPLSIEPGSLLVGEGPIGSGAIDQMPDEAQVCSCNNVTKGQICQAICDKELTTLGDVKSCTQAGTGCGGCLPLVTDLLKSELKSSGKELNNNLCEHFAFSRQELFEIVNIKKIKSFDELLADCGQGGGCEICKPVVASILASLWNEHIVDHATIQDTNDRFLANIQRGGTYSVVPRVPGGEITPEKLIALGEVARKYNLYTKITGGQRVDLFGAPVHQLPKIWEELIQAGFESGHAYGKAMRTVKSCVGTSWCRYAVGDSVGLAIEVENRYRGVRSPHKLKGAVSGCVRECAEAQSKDFGLIATDKGWNLYVCGNGGASPRHADLLAADLDSKTCITYLDRFLMYYIQTADKLTRTSKWLENMEGGIQRLREVVIDDKLGINEELERQMQHLVDSYRCEWKEVVEDPEKRKLFQQFVNTDETEPGIEIVTERGQSRPADWPKEILSVEDLVKSGAELTEGTPKKMETSWVKVGCIDDFPTGGGATIKYGDVQIAVFNFSGRNEWYATQNLCPHRRELVLARGMIGDAEGEPKVACPLHKKTFSLHDGRCLSGEDLQVHVFPVEIRKEEVYIELPDVEQLTANLATKGTCRQSCVLT